MWVMFIIKILLLIFAKTYYAPVMGAMFINQTSQGLKKKLQAKYKISQKVAV